MKKNNNEGNEAAEVYGFESLKDVREFTRRAKVVIAENKEVKAALDDLLNDCGYEFYEAEKYFYIFVYWAHKASEAPTFIDEVKGYIAEGADEMVENFDMVNDFIEEVPWLSKI